jgi:hypothetical protein
MRPTMARLTLARKICRHYFNDLEKGVSTPNNCMGKPLECLSMVRRPFHFRRFLSGGGRSGSRDARFEGEYQSKRSGLWAFAPGHHFTLCHLG